MRWPLNIHSFQNFNAKHTDGRTHGHTDGQPENIMLSLRGHKNVDM